jgi:hypothetical protein
MIRYTLYIDDELEYLFYFDDLLDVKAEVYKILELYL